MQIQNAKRDLTLIYGEGLDAPLVLPGTGRDQEGNLRVGKLDIAEEKLPLVGHDLAILIKGGRAEVSDADLSRLVGMGIVTG